MLYDQMSGGGGTFIRSTDFDPPNDDQDAQGADDFVVPSGESWAIDTVEVSGLGPAPSVDVFIYADAGTLPGTEVFSELAVTPSAAANDFLVAVGPINLGPGTYWLSVQTNDTLGSGGWFWEERSPQAGNPSAWRNPGDALGTGCTDWARRVADCGFGNVGTPDLAFRLLGATGGYTFEGFFTPVDNEPTVNDAKAGQTIAVRWRLTDVDDVPVDDPASFVSVTSKGTSCVGGTPTDVIETYTGDSGLRYLGDGNWQFNWKVPKSYKGHCRVMSLNLSDGSFHTAQFKFS